MFAPLEPKGPGPQSAIAVLVVDDQSAVREGVARLLACGSFPLRGVTTAATGAEALDLAARTRPDVVVLDADLSGEDGLALIPLLRGYSQVMVLTSHGDARTRERATQLGALAFVEKHEPAAALLASIARIAHLNAGGDQSPTPAGADSRSAAGTSSAAPSTPHP
jgi:two-component system nitrate/nitrite response regulator NarL